MCGSFRLHDTNSGNGAVITSESVPCPYQLVRRDAGVSSGESARSKWLNPCTDASIRSILDQLLNNHDNQVDNFQNHRRNISV